MSSLPLACAVVGALAVGVLCNSALRHLRVPEEESEQLFSSLATRTNVLVCTLLALAAGSIASLSGSTWWCWLALWPIGAILAMIDIRTCYLPTQLVRMLWAATAVVVLVLCVMQRNPRPALSAAAGMTFYVVIIAGAWWLGQMGFGDVRLAIAVGALSGAVSGLTFAIVALFAGSVIGALWGTVKRMHGSKAAFAYGPSIIAGPFLALLTAVLST